MTDGTDLDSSAPASPAASPLDAADLRARVQEVVDETVRDQAALLESVSPDLSPLVDAIAALLSGGKRLRPAFAYWGWRGVTGPVSAPGSDDATVGGDAG